ncbi:MAG: DUF420 domain-containing protein [Elusimicrobia bacterium]|nr:DUF420 domain-containing protein [Elusimicrobiota bacterium]
MTYSSLPAVNAVLNASSAVLLLLGYALIRAGRVAAHRAAMGSALAVSAVFLASYLVYHAKVGSVRYQGGGPLRAVYFAILITHTVLAVVNVPLIARTVYLAWRERFEEHKRLARWTFPSWLYVSVTGVVVYWMLYRLPH